MRVTKPLVIAVAAMTMMVAPAAQEPRWVAAWATAHNARETDPDLANSTVRMIVRPTISGGSLRIKLENTMGRSAVTFRAAFAGRLASGSAVVPDTNTRLTFDGKGTLTLAPGAGAWSDAVRFEVRAFERLVVSLDVGDAADISIHTLGLTSNAYARGSRAAEPSGAGFMPTPDGSFYWLAAVDVLSPSAAGAIVAIGDSWVDGRCSGTNEEGRIVPDMYGRWLDVLATRLAAQTPPIPLAVVNEGIGGNRILAASQNGPSTLDRLDRDVLDRAGLTHVIFLQGMNDIGNGASAEAIIAAEEKIIDRVHAKRVRIIAGTLFPLARPDRARWTAPMETQRLAVNAWIRTRAGFDGVIDFDRLMSGGQKLGESESLKPEFHCTDSVHPNPAGYKAMGEFVNLELFRTGNPRR